MIAKTIIDPMPGGILELILSMVHIVSCIILNLIYDVGYIIYRGEINRIVLA